MPDRIENVQSQMSLCSQNCTTGWGSVVRHSVASSPRRIPGTQTSSCCLDRQFRSRICAGETGMFRQKRLPAAFLSGSIAAGLFRHCVSDPVPDSVFAPPPCRWPGVMELSSFFRQRVNRPEQNGPDPCSGTRSDKQSTVLATMPDCCD